ncbi:MAG: DNA adenine methylase [Atribacterota bacterium]
MKNHYPVTLNFDTLECEETFDSRLLHACDRVKTITNPYIGNKRKILYHIIQEFNGINPKFETVLDLFSGSACVGMALRLMNKKVISNDILTSSTYYASAFTQIDGNPLTVEDKEIIFKEGNFFDETFYEKFKNRFTKNELKRLMQIKYNINKEIMNKDMAKYKFIMANIQLHIMNYCFVGGRLNNGQILADKNHRISHDRNKGRELNLQNICWKKIEGGETDNVVLSFDAVDVIDYICEKNISPDIAYIDPPYGGNQSDYNFMYNFFEEYSSFNCDTEEKYLRKNGPKEKFIKSNNYKDNFIKLIKSLSIVPYLVISYNNSSWANIETIQKILKEYRKNVKVKEIDYEYRYRKQLNMNGKEYLIIAE